MNQLLCVQGANDSVEEQGVREEDGSWAPLLKGLSQPLMGILCLGTGKI